MLTGSVTTFEMESFASPAHYVSRDDSSLVIFHGDVDKVVLFGQSLRISKLYNEAGLKVRLITPKSAGHGGRKFFTGSHVETARVFQDELLCQKPGR